MKKPIHLIAAIDKERGLGKDNDLVWNLPTDMKYFKKITTTTKDPNLENAVLMGRKTWQSIPDKYRPLPGRHNVILSKTLSQAPPNTEVFDDLSTAVDSLQNNPLIESIYIIGGASIYNQSFQEIPLTNIYITSIKEKYDCDTFLKPIPKRYILRSESTPHQENNANFTFQVFSKN